MTNANEIILEKIKVSNRHLSKLSFEILLLDTLIFLYDAIPAEECNNFFFIFGQFIIHKLVLV